MQTQSRQSAAFAEARALLKPKARSEFRGEMMNPMKRLVCAAVAIGILGCGGLAQAAAPPAPGPCDTAGHRQFDFWLGAWDVYRADTDKLVAHSLIEKLYGGCAVRENWMPFQGNAGGSLNSYRPSSGEWRQVWTDSANELHDYAGRWDGHALVMDGTGVSPAGQSTKLRMTYAQRPDGSVVQTGYQKTEKDKDWVPSYEFIYRRAAGQPKLSQGSRPSANSSQ
jgi:hypothetical protein